MRSSRVNNISSTSSDAKSERGSIPWVALLALGVAGIILYRSSLGAGGFDFGRFSASFQSLDPKFSALAILFILLSYLGRAIRWEVMIRPLGPTPSLWRLFVGTVIGFTAVVLLGRPGEFVRPWLIGRESRTPFSSQLAVWFFERIYDLLVVVLFFGYGLTHLAKAEIVSSAGPELRYVISSGGVLALSGAAFALLFIFALRFLSASQRQGLLGLLDRLPYGVASRLRPVAANFLDGANACCQPRLQWLVILYTFVEWMIIAGCYWAIFQSFSATRGLTVPDVITIVGLVSFGAILQLPGIGGGMQVAAVAVLTQLFAIGFEEASSLALAIWAVSVTLIVPFGCILAVREGLSFNKLRHLGPEAN
jgi:uncharacterized protein (TIRG00374 family)